MVQYKHYNKYISITLNMKDNNSLTTKITIMSKHGHLNTQNKKCIKYEKYCKSVNNFLLIFNVRNVLTLYKKICKVVLKF